MRGGCLRQGLGLLLLGGILWVAWQHGPQVRGWVEDRLGLASAPAEPSPELAEGAVDRYARLVGGEVDEASFTQEEVESVLRFHPSGFLVPGVSPRSVRLEDGEVTVEIGVAVDLLPTLPELEGLMEILPDTVPVRFRGLLLTLEGGPTVFLVRRIEASGVPLPARLHHRIVETLELGTRVDLPPATVEVPLPPQIRSAYIQRGRLVLTARR